MSAAIGILAMRLAQYHLAQQLGMSALTLAIVLGMVAGNTIHGRIAPLTDPGVGFSKQTLLRLGIVLYGLRLTVQDIAHVGIEGVLIDAAVLASTFVIALWIGVRCLGLDRKTAMLIGAGNSICGAAAVLAAEPVVKARSEQVTVAVATVVVFGTVATFLYPVLFKLNEAWGVLPGGAETFGVYIGSTVHEVAQVVAAGNAISAAAADSAVIAKMVRVMMLAPFLVGLTIWLARHPEHPNAPAEARTGRGVAIPWFAVGFIGVVLLNSIQLLPVPVKTEALSLDNYLLAMAMASLGLTTHVGAIRKAGAKPMVLSLILFGWLVVGGGLLNRAVCLMLG